MSRRIIYVPLLLICSCILTGFILLDFYFSRAIMKRYEADLIRLARSGAQMIDFLPADTNLSGWDKLADTFAENSLFRVTIISPTGVVLGDSRLSVEEIRTTSSQETRPEIKEAASSGLGISMRFSPILQIDQFYAALKFNSYGRKGYFRVAMPMIELKHERMNQRVLFIGFCIVALVVAGILSLAVSKHILNLVEEGNAYLEERVNERTHQIEMLQSIGTQLTACNSLAEAMEIISITTSVLLPDRTGSLALFRTSRDELEVVGTWNGKWEGDLNYTPDLCWGLRSGQPHLGDPESGHISCMHGNGNRKNMLCIPVVSQSVTHGVFHFFNENGEAWSQEEWQLACSVAEHASLTIASLDLRESLRQQAIRDPLTGLYNRRYLLEIIAHEIGRAARRKKKMGLLMIDLDHFKKFNDDYGHDTGDFILSEFGRLVKKLIRQEDIPCRYGGEEFTILLPEADLKQTQIVGEKIRTCVREHNFLYNNEFYSPITLSIGGAVYPDNGGSVGELLKLADNALYQAKKSGRDQVVVSSEAERNTCRG